MYQEIRDGDVVVLVRHDCVQNVIHGFVAVTKDCHEDKRISWTREEARISEQNRAQGMPIDFTQ